VKKRKKLNFTHSGHKAWSLMKKLGDPSHAKKSQHTLNPNIENIVAARLVCMGKLSIDK